LSLIATIVIVFFINKVVNKPSHLLELVPSDAVAVVHFNTRDIAKDVYRYGGFTMDSLALINQEFPYFKNITDPRRTGINVYSELFLFQDEVKEGKYNCLLFNLNSLNNFKTFCATNSMLAAANGKESTIFYSKKDSFYVWVREKEAALLFDVQSPNHLVSIMDKINRKSEENKPFGDLMVQGDNILIWQSQYNTLLNKEFYFAEKALSFKGNLVPGKLSYTGKMEGDVIQKDTTSFFNPSFIKTNAGHIFEGEIKAPHPDGYRETHPLSYLINQWTKTK